MSITLEEYIKLSYKGPDPKSTSKYHKHYEGEEEDYAKLIEYNRELCAKYPWLIPVNVFSGKRITDCAAGEEGFWPGNPEKIPEYNYEYTMADDIPSGWRLAFGDELFERLHIELVKFDYVDKFMITQCKEKYNTLRIYTNHTPRGKLSETYTIIKSDNFNEFDYNKYSYEYIGKDYDKDCTNMYKRREILDKCRISDIIDEYEEKSKNYCIICGKPATWVSKGYISSYCSECKKNYEKKGWSDFTTVAEFYGEE